jgi:electron transfer flavoprotein alpha subunit
MADKPKDCSIQIIAGNCTGCTMCVKTCPFGAISMVDSAEAKKGKLAVIDYMKCTLCGACVESCKFKAIEMTVCKVAPKVALGDYKGVWVFAEQKKGKVQSVVYELLGKGRELADDLGTELVLFLLETVSKTSDELFWRGADKVYLVESAGLKSYQDELIRYNRGAGQEFKPEVLFTGRHRSAGRWLRA